MAVVVVTDSSSRLQPEDLERCGIRQVPLHILLDGKDFRDGVDEVPGDVHQRHATTAGATPAELADAYREALRQSGGDVQADPKTWSWAAWLLWLLVAASIIAVTVAILYAKGRVP